MITTAAQLIAALQEKSKELNTPLEKLEIFFLDDRAHLAIEEISVENSIDVETTEKDIAITTILVLESPRASRTRHLDEKWREQPLPENIALQCIEAYEKLTAVLLTKEAVEEILQNHKVIRHEICETGLKNNIPLLHKFASLATQFFIERDWPAEPSQSEYESLVERIQDEATAEGFQMVITPHKKAPKLIG